jgi:hypothetical protein
MKKKNDAHAHSGGRRVNPGPMQREGRQGRDENVQHKAEFKAGAFIANDPEGGRPNGRLIQRDQNATPPARNKEEKS